tara:strand:- start:1318 stop:1551 length:234 start_codon:yes stop_codon:yes gene_type:complete
MPNIEWKSKTKYVHNVVGDGGNGIVDEQNKLNEDKDTIVVATQIFPLGKDSNGVMKYDAFIYYKENPNKIDIPKDMK